MPKSMLQAEVCVYSLLGIPGGQTEDTEMWFDHRTWGIPDGDEEHSAEAKQSVPGTPQTQVGYSEGYTIWGITNLTNLMEQDPWKPNIL
jgi:hypothetical protein